MSYRPFLELGEGGMAKVFLASAVGPGGFNKLVVLKVMRATDLADDTICQMFADEARLSARFNHPNLVQVQEVNLAAEPPYLVMEYLDGKPLSALRANTRITPGMRLVILSEVLNGLHHAHELCHFDGSPLGIVHRDVSPQNVFVTYDGAVKVLDFGIAKQIGAASRTQTGEIKGKLAYMAPEQLLGSGIDRRADVFAVGSMLWEAAAGRRMWHGLGEAAMMHRLATGEIPRPGAYAAIDPELEEIIVKATAADPDQRFQTALELQAALDAYIERSAERSSLRAIGAALAESFHTERRRQAELVSNALKESLAPPPPPANPSDAEADPDERRSRARLFMAGAVVLIALVGIAALRLRRSEPERRAIVPSSRAVTPVASGTAPASLKSERTEPAPPERTPPPAASSATTTDNSKHPGKAPRSAPVRAAAVPAFAGTSAAEAPRAPQPEQTAADHCNPPFYFVGGVKTYKPECL